MSVVTFVVFISCKKLPTYMYKVLVTVTYFPWPLLIFQASVKNKTTNKRCGRQNNECLGIILKGYMECEGKAAVHDNVWHMLCVILR